jgi:hypothetical protein
MKGTEKNVATLQHRMLHCCNIKQEGCCNNVTLLFQAIFHHFAVLAPWIIRSRILPSDRVDNSRSLSKPISGGFFVSGSFGQPISSWIEVPSKFFCWHFHPSPYDMRQHPTWHRCLSSASLRQGTQEHFARRPYSGGSAGCHRRCALPVALCQTFAPALSRLHERYSQ